LRPWKSRWFSAKDYATLLREDVELREFLTPKLKGMLVDSIEIERSPAVIAIIIKTARPGLLIGRGGEGVERLKKEINTFLAKLRKQAKSVREGRIAAMGATKKETSRRFPEIRLTIEEIKFPETHARIMAEQIAQDLEKRLPFRRTMKQNLAKMMAAREVKGAKIALSGRLDGNEMARFEWLKGGKIPLQTLRADVDFARGRAKLPYGDLGIKVWIYRGEVFGDKPQQPVQPAHNPKNQ
jgi:small subunit ribosomal protein S3